MKSIFTICTFAIVAIAGTSAHILSLAKNAEIYSAKEYLVRAIVSNCMDRLVNEIRNMNNTREEQMVMATILPPFPDPVIIPPTVIPVDINLDFVNPPVTIAGNVETKSNLEITGLNGLQDKFEFSIIDGRLSWDVTIPTISVSANDYTVELEIKEGATVSHNVAGGGALTGSLGV
ncbi:uncharacterized protein LOC110844920 [Folsomia candida]|uniref:uncharacterized protein LOC110844920 n=1 Tax=Folsomia candida TaxID=158441 RepID=UPI0016052150|nr:uncharacterized protein LOC110844920 [Folsomia candida]